MSVWLQFTLGLVTSYLAATVSESYLHRTVGHATPRLRRFWAQHPRLCGFLTRADYRHAVVHHGLTFARDHVTQFPFNLLLGGDQILGTHRRGCPDDFHAMEAIGIPTH